MMMDKIRQSPIVTVTGIFSFSSFYFNIQHFSRKLPYFLMYKGLLLPYDFMMSLDSRLFVFVFVFLKDTLDFPKE